MLSRQSAAKFNTIIIINVQRLSREGVQPSGWKQRAIKEINFFLRRYSPIYMETYSGPQSVGGQELTTLVEHNTLCDQDI